MTYPPTQPPAEPPATLNWVMSTPPPKRRLPLVAAIAAGVLIVAAGLGVAFALGRNSNNHPAAAAPSPSWSPITWSTPKSSIPPPPAGALSDAAECALLVPTLEDGADLIKAIAAHPDGSTVDRAKLDKTVTDLHTLWNTGSTEMRADITQQIEPLEALQGVLAGRGNTTLHLENFRASGVRIAERRRPYATG